MKNYDDCYDVNPSDALNCFSGDISREGTSFRLVLPFVVIMLLFGGIPY